MDIVNLKDNQTLLVEVLDVKVPDIKKGSSISDLPEGAEAVGVLDDMVDSLEALKESVANITTSIKEGFKENTPDEFTIEIGFGFAGKGAIPFIVSAESDASIKIKATWKK